MRIFFAFMVLGSVALTGCYDMHGFTPPVIPMGDAGPMVETDAGEPIVIEPDSGSVVTADAGSDAGMPSESDAGSDAGAPDVDAGSTSVCDAVDVPADGSGRVIVRVEGGGDMTVPPDTDFVAFSVTIENHTNEVISATVILREASLSADCAVERPSISFTNECDASNAFRPSSGSCGAGPCFTNCGENGPVLASGTSIRFTMFGHTRASGLFVIDMGSSSPWVWFNDAAGVRLPSERVVGNTGPAPIATITVP